MPQSHGYAVHVHQRVICPRHTGLSVAMLVARFYREEWRSCYVTAWLYHRVDARAHVVNRTAIERVIVWIASGKTSQLS